MGSEKSKFRKRIILWSRSLSALRSISNVKTDANDVSTKSSFVVAKAECAKALETGKHKHNVMRMQIIILF